MIVPSADIKMSYKHSSRCSCQIFIISQETVVITSCDPQSDNVTPPLSKLICMLVHREYQQCPGTVIIRKSNLPQFSVYTAWEKNRMRLSLWIIIALAYISAPLIPPSLPISGRSQGVLRHDANSDMALIITPFAKCCNLCRFSIVVLHTEIRQRPVNTSKNSPPPVEYILNEEYLKLSDGSQRRRDRPVWCRRIYGYFASWLWGVRRRKETGDANRNLLARWTVVGGQETVGRPSLAGQFWNCCCHASFRVDQYINRPTIRRLFHFHTCALLLPPI